MFKVIKILGEHIKDAAEEKSNLPIANKTVTSKTSNVSKRNLKRVIYPESSDDNSDEKTPTSSFVLNDTTEVHPRTTTLSNKKPRISEKQKQLNADEACSSNVSGITIMRRGNKSEKFRKTFPCGYCEYEDVTWIARPQEHFRRYHSSQSLLQEASRLLVIETNPSTTINDRKKAKTDRLSMENLIFNTSVYLHNERVKAKGSGL